MTPIVGLMSKRVWIEKYAFAPSIFHKQSTQVLYKRVFLEILSNPQGNIFARKLQAGAP